MKYTMTTPCDACPFLISMKHGFTLRRLNAFAAGPRTFPCHKTATTDEETSNFIATEDSVACAGALIFCEKRDRPNQMMRIAERLGFYDRTKLNMSAKVR